MVLRSLWNFGTVTSHHETWIVLLWFTRNALGEWRICLPKPQVPEWSSTGSLVCYSYVSMAAVGFAFVCACVRACVRVCMCM